MTFSRRITPIPTRDALSDVKSVNRKVTIDPLSLVIHQHAAWVYIHARRYDTAIEECRKALEIDPNYSLGHFWMGIALSQNSRHEDAITALENQSPGASGFEENVRSSMPRRRRRTGADPVFARPCIRSDNGAIHRVQTGSVQSCQ
jgi:hypothetical protein